MIRRALALSFASACIGALALVVTPGVSAAADVPASYKSAKAKKKPAKKGAGSASQAGMPQSKQMRMQYNPPGSRFPSSWRY